MKANVKADDEADVTDDVKDDDEADGTLDPVLVVTEDDLKSEVDTSPSAEAAYEKWEQH